MLVCCSWTFVTIFPSVHGCRPCRPAQTQLLLSSVCTTPARVHQAVEYEADEPHLVAVTLQDAAAACIGQCCWQRTAIWPTPDNCLLKAQSLDCSESRCTFDQPLRMCPPHKVTSALVSLRLWMATYAHRRLTRSPVNTNRPDGFLPTVPPRARPRICGSTLQLG